MAESWLLILEVGPQTPPLFVNAPSFRSNAQQLLYVDTIHLGPPRQKLDHKPHLSLPMHQPFEVVNSMKYYIAKHEYNRIT